MIHANVKELKAPKTPIDLLSTTVIHSILGDVHFDSFRSTMHERPIVFRDSTKGGRLSIIKELMNNFAIDSLLEETASEGGVQVWLRHPNNKTAPLDSIRVDPKQAHSLYLAGHSLYCRAPASLESQIIQNALRNLQFGVVGNGNDRFGRGEIEMFYSRAGHITNFHTDFQENITIQLTGSKKWTFRASALTYPLRSVTPHFRADDHSQLSEQQLKAARLCDPALTRTTIPTDNTMVLAGDVEVVVYPGDVLYHPAGVWHRVECLEDSVSMNLSLTAASYADVFCSGLLQLLWKNPEFRRSVRYNDGQGDVMAQIVAAVPGLLQGIAPCDFMPPPPVIPTEKTIDDGEEEEEEEEEEVEHIVSYMDEGVEGADEVDSEAKYRLNPLAEILAYEDLAALGGSPSLAVQERLLLSNQGSTPLDAYVVHRSFGNETFESLSRIVCIIPRSLKPAMNLLAELHKKPLTISEFAALVPFESAVLVVQKKRKATNSGGGDSLVDNTESIQKLFARVLIPAGIISHAL